MTAKEQLRERIETLTEHQAQRTLRLLDDLGDDEPGDALDELLAAAPIDDEPTTPEEDQGAREAREQIKRGDVFSAEQISARSLDHRRRLGLPRWRPPRPPTPRRTGSAPHHRGA